MPGSAPAGAEDGVYLLFLKNTVLGLGLGLC